MTNQPTTCRTNHPEYQIKVSLNPILCNATFKNGLRTSTSDKPKAFPSDINKVSKINRKQVSHIPTLVDNSQLHNPKARKYIESKIMFNDAYVDNNPKINKGKYVRYEIEEKIRNSGHVYSDDLYIQPQRKAALERKIKDTYASNPIAMLTPEQIAADNLTQRNRVGKRAEVIEYYMGSDNLKKTFNNHKREIFILEQIPKITNDTNIILMQKENERSRGRHFRKSSYDKTSNPLSIL